MVDEVVDFVFGGGGGAVVVFLFERLRNLYNQSIRSVIQNPNQKKKKKELPEVDSTVAVVLVEKPIYNQSDQSYKTKTQKKELPKVDSTVALVLLLIDPIDTGRKGIVGTPPPLLPISDLPKLPFDFKFEVVDDDEEANFVLK
jgi:hypothetical protein